MQQIAFLDWQNKPAHAEFFLAIRWDAPLDREIDARPFTAKWFRQQGFTLYGFPTKDLFDAHLNVAKAHDRPFIALQTKDAALWLKAGLPAVLHEGTVPGVASGFGNLKLDPFCEREIRPLH